MSFVEVTGELGLDFVHTPGASEEYLMPAVMAGGGAIFDYDGDGDLDLYLVSAGGPNRLFRQRADGRFEDATEAAGVGDTGYGMGAAVGDVDNDGDPDLLVTNYGPDVLYRNDGAGTFTDVTVPAGIAIDGWSTSAAFLDYDRDGWLDLYVARYVRYDRGRRCVQEGGRRDFCGPTQFQGATDVLYRNLGGGRFRDVTSEAGIASASYAGLGVVAADFDDDGLIDLYVANDADPNLLWINQGDGTFVDQAVVLGAAFNRYGVARAGMGVTAGDADGDGDLDLFVTNLIAETHTFYDNRGALGFEDDTAARGLTLPSAPYTGFGTAFLDWDADGDLDLALVNGAVKRRPLVLPGAPTGFWAPYAEPNQLFQNTGRGEYVEVSAGDFGTPVEVSRGLMPADLDRDGDLDLVVTSLAGPARLYRNQGGERAAWLEVRLFDPRYRREALGAKLTLIVGEKRIVRHAVPAGGYLTSGHASIHVGLGEREAIDEIVVRWPDGEMEAFGGVATRQRLTLSRGEGQGHAEATSND